nr:hypothetical protein [Tanacetum cinerariifolium]
GTGESGGDHVNLLHDSPLSGGHTSDIAEDIEYMDTEEALNEGRQSTVSTARPDVSTARLDVSTVRLDVSTTRQELSTAGPTTTPTTSTIFDDEEMTLADTLIKLKDDKAKENEKYTVDERAKLLAEYFKRRKKQLAEERVVAIRNKPPTKNQLRRLMMTYLKIIGRFTHSQLNKKSFEDIHGLYLKEHELIADFVPIGSEEDERMIGDMNKKAKEESSDKGVNSTKKRKEILRMKRMSKRQKTDVDLEEEEKLKTFLKIDPDEEGIIDYEVMDKRFPIINWESKFYQYDRHGAEGIYYGFLDLMESQDGLKPFLKWLIAESASDAAYDLLRFIQKHIDESEGHDRGEKDL